MRKWLIAASLCFVAVAVAWVWLHPGFDSVATLCAAVVGVIVAFMTGGERSPPRQRQHVSGRSTAIQAGRDVNIGREE